MRDLKDENNNLKLNYIEYDTLQARLNENLILCVLLFAEIESLRNRIKNKEKEVEEIRRSSLAPFRKIGML